jgi:hypothetical protein
MSASAAAATPADDNSTLPSDLWAHVCSFLQWKDAAQMMRLCHAWSHRQMDKAFWPQQASVVLSVSQRSRCNRFLDMATRRSRLSKVKINHMHKLSTCPGLLRRVLALPTLTDLELTSHDESSDSDDSDDTPDSDLDTDSEDDDVVADRHDDMASRVLPSETLRRACAKLQLKHLQWWVPDVHPPECLLPSTSIVSYRGSTEVHDDATVLDLKSMVPFTAARTLQQLSVPVPLTCIVQFEWPALDELKIWVYEQRPSPNQLCSQTHLDALPTAVPRLKTLEIDGLLQQCVAPGEVVIPSSWATRWRLESLSLMLSPHVREGRVPFHHWTSQHQASDFWRNDDAPWPPVPAPNSWQRVPEHDTFTPYSLTDTQVAVLGQLPAIITIDLTGNARLQCHFMHELAAQQPPPPLKELDLTETLADDSVLQTVCRTFALTALWLARCPLVTDEGLKCLAIGTSAAELKILDLGHDPLLSADVVSHVVTRLPKLSVARLVDGTVHESAVLHMLQSQQLLLNACQCLSIQLRSLEGIAQRVAPQFHRERGPRLTLRVSRHGPQRIVLAPNLLMTRTDVCVPCLTVSEWQDLRAHIRRFIETRNSAAAGAQVTATGAAHPTPT